MDYNQESLMNGKIKFECAIALLLILLDVFLTVKISHQNNGRESKSLNISTLSSATDQNITVQVITKQYNKEGVEAEYPMLVSGGSEEQLSRWNQIIEEDFNKILAIYSFHPITAPAKVPSNRTPTILRIKYEMKLNNENYISILYTAAYNNPTSAHPTELVYTTNINKSSSNRMKLSDVVILSEDFVKNFRTWEYISPFQENAEWNKAVKDYIANLSDEDLLSGFQNADRIDSDNQMGIYSYLTEDRLGISLGVPNYIGDHAEFEGNYSDIKDYLQPDFKF